MINTHNRIEEFIFFANEIKDWEKLLDFYMSERAWTKALDSLSRHSDVDLYYKSSPILMENAPTETVDLWQKQSRLNPKYLIPSLMKYNMMFSHLRHEKVNIPPHDDQNEAIRYLQYVVTNLGNADQVCSKYLI